MTLLTRLRALDLNALRHHLEYDESSPTCLRWRVPSSTRHRQGDVAGKPAAYGYVKVYIHNRAIFAHHVVMLLHNSWPQDNQEVDHIDRNRANNCFTNLRWVTRAQNLRNTRARSSTGYKYVHHNRSNPIHPYMATYRAPNYGKTIYVGSFSDPLEAHQAAIAYRDQHYGALL